MDNGSGTDIGAQAGAIVLAMAPGKQASGGRDLNLVDDLGFDSLTLFEVIVALEDELGLRLVGSGPPADIATVGDVEDYISRFVQATA